MMNIRDENIRMLSLLIFVEFTVFSVLATAIFFGPGGGNPAWFLLPFGAAGLVAFLFLGSAFIWKFGRN